MDGLLDFLKTPEGQGLLSAGVGYLATAQRGTPVNNVGKAGMAGLLGYSNALNRQQQEQENAVQNQVRQMQMQKMQGDMAAAQRKQELAAAYRNTLPEQDRGIFDLAPDKYLEHLPQFQKPQLVEVADPDEPLRTRKVWMRPGETSGAVAGYGAMPEILDPRVQGVKERIARAGKSDVSVSYGSPVSGIDANGNPVFFQPNKAGGAPAIVPGVKPHDVEKPLTESQSKASAFLGQMRSAEDRLKQVPFDTTNIANQADAALAGTPLNILASKEAQQMGQAREQWAEAFLRFKTGAAATKDEVSRNVKTYFPQIGDSAEVIAQKNKMRQQAANDMVIAAGKGADKVGSVYGNAKRPPMKGQVMDGWRFNGGNPADPNAWEKQ